MTENVAGTGSQPQARKGVPWWVWALGGCGCLLVLGAAAAFLLVPMLVARVSGELESAKQTLTSTQMDALNAVLTDWSLQHGGDWPRSLAHLGGFDPDDPDAADLSYDWEDVWGNPIQYLPPERPGARPRLRSLGSDGQPGGEGAAADIELVVGDG